METKQLTILEFLNKPSLRDLIVILKKIFTKNKKAKNCITYMGRLRAYGDKNLLLRKALNIAKYIDSPFFKYGYKIDESMDIGDPFKYIYYFEIIKYQVSFHCNIMFLGVPEFLGEWINEKNEYFPFDLRKLKKIINL